MPVIATLFSLLVLQVPLTNKSLVQTRAIPTIPQAVTGLGVISGGASLRRTTQLESEQHENQVRIESPYTTLGVAVPSASAL